MRYDRWLALPLIAMLGMMTGPCIARDRVIVMTMCSGTRPVRVPIDGRGDADGTSACHAMCPRRSASDETAQRKG